MNCNFKFCYAGALGLNMFLTQVSLPVFVSTSCEVEGLPIPRRVFFSLFVCFDLLGLAGRVQSSKRFADQSTDIWKSHLYTKNGS